MEPAAVVPLVASAAVLGVTHGLEPDHAAGILSLSAEADGAGRSALIGAAFATGHVLLVWLWLLVARLVLAVPAIRNTMAVVGTVGGGVGVLVRPLRARSRRTIGAVHLAAGAAVFASAVWVLVAAAP